MPNSDRVLEEVFSSGCWYESGDSLHDYVSFIADRQFRFPRLRVRFKRKYNSIYRSIPSFFVFSFKNEQAFYDSSLN